MGDILRDNGMVVEMNTEFEIQPIQLLKHEIHCAFRHLYLPRPSSTNLYICTNAQVSHGQFFLIPKYDFSKVLAFWIQHPDCTICDNATYTHQDRITF